MGMAKAIDLTGMKFGRLTVIGLNEEESSKCRGKKGRKIRYWTCQCECGNTHVVQAQKLKTGEVKSCGCYNSEVASERMCKLNETRQENPFKGKKHTKEWKESRKGAGNPMYNPNLTEEERESKRCKQPKYRQWAKEVKEQANYTCDICGQYDEKPHAHHLDSYGSCKDKRYDVTNGVCLCSKCHIEFHSWMGGTHVECTSDDYLEFKNEKLLNNEVSTN